MMGDGYDVTVQVGVDGFVGEDEVGCLRRAAVAALRHQAVAMGSGVTILLADDAYLQGLNEQFRGEAKPTDVLSFAAGEGAFGVRGYVGDIAISVPYAARAAEKQGHDLLGELCLLVVHGVLHLLGYDHAEPEEKAQMWAVQGAILNDGC